MNMRKYSDEQIEQSIIDYIKTWTIDELKQFVFDDLWHNLMNHATETELTEFVEHKERDIKP